MAATTNPPEFPPLMAADPARDAERAMFDALKAGLPSEVIVYYGWRWFKSGTKNRVFEGEGDFVLIWPGKGMLVIEVKGGREIERDASGQWFSTTRHGNRNPINDPIMQVEKNADAVADRIALSVPRGDRPIVCWALAFPQIHALTGQFEIPRERLLFTKDLAHMREAIEKTFDHWSRSRASRWTPLGPELLQRARAVMRPEVKFIDVRSLAEIVEEVEEKLEVLLTQEQRHALGMLEINARVRVCGSAGTGKTLIAQRYAINRAASGARVLLLCHNRLLGAELERWADGQPHIHAGTFGSFALQVLGEAGRHVNIPEGPDAYRFWNSDLPALLLDVLGSSRGESLRFDVVIVDEAQDFAEDSLAVVEYLARPENGQVHLFYDDNQNIYRKQLAKQLRDEHWTTVPLTQNLRNTRSIANLAGQIIKDAAIQANTVAGPPPHIVASGSDLVGRTVSEVLRKLVKDDGVDPSSIAILVCRRDPEFLGLAEGDYAQWDAVGSRPLQEDEAVLCVRADLAKGLERPVVVLVDAASTLDDGVEDAFIAVTRAQAMLVVVTTRASQWSKLLS